MGERHTRKAHAKEGLSKACDLFDRKRIGLFRCGATTAVESWSLTARKMRAKISQETCEESEGKVYGLWKSRAASSAWYSAIVTPHKVFSS